jgi:hypothetical protein
MDNERKSRPPACYTALDLVAPDGSEKGTLWAAAVKTEGWEKICVVSSVDSIAS